MEEGETLISHGGRKVKRKSLGRFFMPVASFAQARILTILPLSVLLFSCSWISSRESLIEGDESTATASTSVQKSVPKEQYDQLLKRYEILLQEKQGNSTAVPVDGNAIANAFENKDASEIAGQIANLPETPELAETVDVFASQEKGATTSSNDMAAMPVENLGDMEGDITRLRKAQDLVNQNKFDQGLSIIKELEKAPSRQIRVRAKFLLGEILFKQSEFDLAMQVYEEIVQKEAFSGIVLKVLGRLIVCSEKLKLAPKQERYYSILHDFFEG
jgi:tetratricopeptide (TPR) repeat protein